MVFLKIKKRGLVSYQMQFDLLLKRVYKSAYVSRYNNCIKKGETPKRAKELAESYATSQAKTLSISRESNPLKYYCPNEPGIEVINTFANSTKVSNTPIILYSAGNGLGKTEVALHILLNLVLSPKNGYFEQGVFLNWKFPKRIWYVTTGTVIESRVMPFLRELFKVPQNDNSRDTSLPTTFKESKEGSSHTKTVVFSNGWTLEFKTHDQDKAQFESASVGLIICDEPMPEHIYRALLSRRRLGAIMLLPMTPLDMEPYIEEEILNKIADEVPGYFMITGSVWDASKKLHPLRGHLQHDIIESMIEGYDEDEMEARINGVPTHFSERIYSNFDKKNIVSPLDFPIEDAVLYIQSVDPHDGRPCAVGYMAVMSNGRKIFFADTPTDHSKPFWKMKRLTTAKEEVQEWIKVEEAYNLPSHKIKRVMDRHFGWQVRGGKTLSKIYYDAGEGSGRNFMFYASYKSNGEENEITYGHNIVREGLGNILEDGYPEIVVWDSCYHIINGFKKYIRKRPSSKADMAKAVGGTVIVEKYKDFNDMVRYACCANHSVNTTSRKKKRIPVNTEPVYYNYSNRRRRRA